MIVTIRPAIEQEKTPPSDGVQWFVMSHKNQASAACAAASRAIGTRNGEQDT